MAISLTGLFNDDVMHFILSALSLLLLGVSANAFRSMRTGRYLLLVLAFAFFALDNAVQLWQQLYYGDALLTLPLIGLHVTHLLELMMSISFIAALLYPAGLRREAMSP